MAMTLAAVAPSGVAFAQADVDAFSRLPAQKIAGVQAGWHVNRTLEAFTEAVERQRPLILVLGDATSKLTLAFAQYVAPCPHLNQLAGAATFAYGSPASDEFARRIASHLTVTLYPTITILTPRTDQLVELYRLEGFFDAASTARSLYQALVQSNYWPPGMPAPAPLPTNYLAYPNMACTLEGAKHLGIVDAGATQP